MKRHLVFVYNADSGLFNTVSDMAHKLLSPTTYECKLCAITHHHIGMRSEWKSFISSLDAECEFLHRDQLKRKYPEQAVNLPAVFVEKEQGIELLIGPNVINACTSIEALEHIIVDQMRHLEP